MARHWRCWHPELNKADYQPTVRSGKSVSPKNQQISKNQSPKNQQTPKNQSGSPKTQQAMNVQSGSPKTQQAMNVQSGSHKTQQVSLPSSVSPSFMDDNQFVKSYLNGGKKKRFVLSAVKLEENKEANKEENKETTTNNEEVIDIENFEMKEEEEEETKTMTMSQQFSPLTPNLLMTDGKYVCSFEGCDYMTKYNSNMWRHQRKYNHFIGANITL
jgi:hypothetical protein